MDNYSIFYFIVITIYSIRGAFAFYNDVCKLFKYLRRNKTQKLEEL